MISVVMASYLSPYKGGATNRVEKFHRAVRSFLNQGVGELIIVSDGCDITVEESKKYNNENIKVYRIEKQQPFSGKVRQYGIEQSTFDWVCYLDTDDEFSANHLNSIISQIGPTLDWVYFDDIVQEQYRNCSLNFNMIGTSCIAHKRDINATWPDGYGHDWNFINQLGNNFKKIFDTGYIVHHIKKGIDN